MVTLTVTRHISSSLREVSTWRFREQIARSKKTPALQATNARKLHFCKQPFESIQGQIAFKNTVQCVNKQTVVLLLHPRAE